MFAISILIVENDLRNKIIHVLSLSNTVFMYMVLPILPPNYLKILFYILC
jgi:hypothetical protein